MRYGYAAAFVLSGQFGKPSVSEVACGHLNAYRVLPRVREGIKIRHDDIGYQAANKLFVAVAFFATKMEVAMRNNAFVPSTPQHIP